MTSQTGAHHRRIYCAVQDPCRTGEINGQQNTEYFIEGLNGGILQKIFALNPLPVTINDWYTYAARFDSQHRRLQEILKRKNRNTRFQTQTKKTNIPRFLGSYQNDPNAMDVD